MELAPAYIVWALISALAGIVGSMALDAPRGSSEKIISWTGCAALFIVAVTFSVYFKLF